MFAFAFATADYDVNAYADADADAEIVGHTNADVDAHTDTAVDVTVDVAADPDCHREHMLPLPLAAPACCQEGLVLSLRPTTFVVAVTPPTRTSSRPC